MVSRVFFSSALFFLLLLPVAAGAQEAAEEVVLITGLDGGSYEPYQPEVVEQVQRALQQQGLYTGEITGEMDEATMKAIGEFQEQHGLAVSGVPSPRTRSELLGGE